jgi:magnesium chelatase family protein
MLSRVQSASLCGIEAHLVEVEVDIGSRGLPHFYIVGLPDAAVKESRDRVRAALKNNAYNFPLRPVTINLAPADLKKEGSSFDLPIAMGLVSSEGILKDPEVLKSYLLTGELSLDGRLKPVKGALSVAMLARRHALNVILPVENAPEAAVVKEVAVYGAQSLPDVIEFLRGAGELKQFRTDMELSMRQDGRYEDDFLDVKGQEHAKRALEVAASGGHNALMIGPPGAGKTMLSKRLPSVLPPMSFEEALETTRIHSVAGTLRDGQALMAIRPFRSPHHTISDVALIGGGQFPRPGEVSLSHNGVLFLDELPEFKRSVLEVLRQPLENGEVTVSRAAASISYPSRFMLVAAMNPCPCGYLGDEKHRCSCTAGQILRYRSRVSGPLLDRIDIHIEVPAVPYKDLKSEDVGERSETIRDRVLAARLRQQKRFEKDGIYTNGQMKAKHLKKYCKLSTEAHNLFESAVQKLALSARAYSRVLRVSRTIADMEGSADITLHHLSEAIQYRSLDRAVF